MTPVLGMWLLHHHAEAVEASGGGLVSYAGAWLYARMCAHERVGACLPPPSLFRCSCCDTRRKTHHPPFICRLQGQEAPAHYESELHDHKVLDGEMAKGLKLDMVDPTNRVHPLSIPPGTVMDSMVSSRLPAPQPPSSVCLQCPYSCC